MEVLCGNAMATMGLKMDDAFLVGIWREKTGNEAPFCQRMRQGDCPSTYLRQVGCTHRCPTDGAGGQKNVQREILPVFPQFLNFRRRRCVACKLQDHSVLSWQEKKAKSVVKTSTAIETMVWVRIALWPTACALTF